MHELLKLIATISTLTSLAQSRDFTLKIILNKSGNVLRYYDFTRQTIPYFNIPGMVAKRNKIKQGDYLENGNYVYNANINISSFCAEILLSTTSETV